MTIYEPVALTSGHWETVRGIQRYVFDEPPPPDLPVWPTCLMCDRELSDHQRISRGMCGSCYEQTRRRERANNLPPVRTRIDMAALAELHAQGLSSQQIALQLGHSMNGVWKALRRLRSAA